MGNGHACQCWQLPEPNLRRAGGSRALGQSTGAENRASLMFFSMEQHWFKGRACLGPGFRQRHILAGHIGDPPPVFLTPPHPTPTAPGVYKATFGGDKSCVSAQVAARSADSAIRRKNENA